MDRTRCGVCTGLYPAHVPGADEHRKKLCLVRSARALQDLSFRYSLANLTASIATQSAARYDDVVKRWASPLIRICVFLLLGAIINIAVAWGCVQWVERMEYEAPTSLDAMKFWNTHPIRSELWERARFDFPRVRTLVHDGVGVRQEIDWANAWQTDVGLHVGTSLNVRAGWPSKSLRGHAVFLRAPVDHWTHEDLIANAYSTGDRYGRGWRDFPTQPIWSGWALNTLFYAGILWGGWLMFAAPFALRRRRRIKRGLCPACAYPLGDSAVCTECGTPVAPPAR
jgi:hypothetical protein